MSYATLLPVHGMTTTMSRKDLKKCLLDSDGVVFSNGYCCDIKSKHLGVGVYKVWLERKG